jgi:hypothetical protein
MLPRPKLFVASSHDALKKGALYPLVRILKRELPEIEIVPWNRSGWKNLKTALETLSESIVEYSYAVFLAFPDDVVTVRGAEYHSTRDNVIFEFGLFFSHLGRERTFLVAPDELKLPDGISLRILSDAMGGFRAGKYVVESMKPRVKVTYQLSGLVKRIKEIERTRINGDRKAAIHELKRQTKALGAELMARDKNDSYYTGKVKAVIECLMLHKAQTSEKSLADTAKDILLYFESVPDLCDVRQLADVQSYERGIKMVWVFADGPMEVQPGTDEDFETLRKRIIKNLQNGVKYVYFVPKLLSAKEIDRINSGHKVSAGAWQDLRKNISLVLVDPRLFKTYFTLHFNKDGDVQSVYMSSVMKDRKDLLIQVSDQEHTERIYRCIRALGQNSHNDYDVSVLDLVSC